MVPTTEVPPGMPLTVQETLVSVVPVTFARKVCEVPRRSEAAAGVTVTAIAAGTGGGSGGVATGEVTLLTVLAAQPWLQAAAARSTRNGRAMNGRWSTQALLPFCERGRMPRRNAGEGPRGEIRTPRLAKFCSRKGGPRKRIELRELKSFISRIGNVRSGAKG